MEFMCPHCGAPVEFEERELGIAKTCPDCQGETIVHKVFDCSDCGGKVSLKAATCPHCGAPADSIRPKKAQIPEEKKAPETAPAPLEPSASELTPIPETPPPAAAPAPPVSMVPEIPPASQKPVAPRKSPAFRRGQRGFQAKSQPPARKGSVPRKREKRYDGFGGELAKGIHASKSFVGAAFLTLILYYLGFYIFGLIANLLYLSSANHTKRMIGYSPPGRGCLVFLLWVHLIIPLLIVLAILGAFSVPFLR